jgi:hypothetical protein
MAETKHSTFRLTPKTRAMLARLAKLDKITRTAVLERLIGDETRRRLWLGKL